MHPKLEGTCLHPLSRTQLVLSLTMTHSPFLNRLSSYELAHLMVFLPDTEDWARLLGDAPATSKPALSSQTSIYRRRYRSRRNSTDRSL